MLHVQQVFEHAGGEFISSSSVLLERLSRIRAFVFDWDGVFNTGVKFGKEGSPFSEVDSMGTNMLRFGYFLKHDTLPPVAVITGEHNPSAIFWAGREHVAALYSKSADKRIALEHFCTSQGVSPSEVAYFFDDVLDVPVASLVGVRILVGRRGSPLFTEFVKHHQLADYITAQDGGSGAIREGCELLMGLMGVYDMAIQSRASFSEEYSTYLRARNALACSYWVSAPYGVQPDQTI